MASCVLSSHRWSRSSWSAGTSPAASPRIQCDHCKEDRLLAFSCKGRWFCPSCSGTDPPGETTLDPWLDDPFPDYDTEPVVAFSATRNVRVCAQVRLSHPLFIGPQRSGSNPCLTSGPTLVTLRPWNRTLSASDSGPTPQDCQNRFPMSDGRPRADSGTGVVGGRSDAPDQAGKACTVNDRRVTDERGRVSLEHAIDGAIIVLRKGQRERRIVRIR